MDLVMLKSLTKFMIELAKAYDEGGYVPEGDDELENANEWLLDNIRQEDAMDWELRLTIFKMNNSNGIERNEL